MASNTLTQERLKKLLKYDPESGVLIWRIDRTGGTRAGNVAGYTHDRKKGYLGITIDGKNYKLARICFFHFHGYIPEIVDHINRETTDNRICNLRPCNIRQNNCNRKSAGVSSYIGVSPAHGKWKAQIKVMGEVVYLGLYGNEKDAAIAYNDAAHKYHGEFANLNKLS